MGNKTTTAIGLDRLDNDKHYELDNVVSCCNVCNTIKNKNLTAQETTAAVKMIILLRQNPMEANVILQQISNQLGLL